MGGVHSLVAEVAVDFEDRFHPPDNEPLEIELRGDAQVAVDPQSVVVGDEGAGVGAAGDGVHHRGFHFEEAFFFKETAHQRDDAAAELEGLLDLRVHDHIQVALAVADLLVGQAVELFGQGMDRFGDDTQIGAVEGDLPGAGDERIPFGLDDITHFDELFDLVVVPFGKVVAVVVDLHQSFAVFELGEGRLAHDPDEFDPAGEAVVAIGSDALPFGAL